MFTIIHSCSLLLARYVQYWGEESYCNLVLRKWQEAGGAAGLSTQAHWNLPLTSWTYLTVIDTHTHTHMYIYTHSTERTQNYPKTTVFVVRTKSCFPCVRLRVRTSLVVQARRFSALRSCHHGFRVRCIDSAFVSICQCRALVSAFALGFYTFLLMLKRAAICCRFVSGRRELQPS